MAKAKGTPQRVDYAALQETLEEAVQNRIPENEMAGVAFSAGVDSGILAFVMKKYTKKLVLLTVGVKGSADFARAEKMARKWKLKHVKKVLTEKEIKEKYALAGKVLKTKDHLQCTIGVVNLAVSELAHQQRIRTLFVGSGADELFCGYGIFDSLRDDPAKCTKMRAEKVKNVDAHDVQREITCGKHYGVSLQAPFLDPAFMKLALKVPAIENLREKYGELRKAVLRRLGEKMHVPNEIISAPKKAMQYGSGVSKIANRIRDT